MSSSLFVVATSIRSNRIRAQKRCPASPCDQRRSSSSRRLSLVKSGSRAKPREAARYQSSAKQHEANKVERRHVLGALLRLLDLKRADGAKAVVLDDVGVESSKVVAASTPLAPADIVVFNYGDASKLRRMQRDARGIATVLQGDAHHAMHLLPPEFSGELCLFDGDFCGCATTILDGGSIQAAVPRMSQERPSVLALTYSGRNNCKHKADDPDDHIFAVVKASAERHGLQAALVYEHVYGLMHAIIFLLLPKEHVHGFGAGASNRMFVLRAIAAVEGAKAELKDPKDREETAEESDTLESEASTSTTTYAFSKPYGYEKILAAKKKKQNTNKAGVWEFKVLWTNGETTWEPHASFNASDSNAHRSMRELVQKADAMAGVKRRRE